MAPRPLHTKNKDNMRRITCQVVLSNLPSAIVDEIANYDLEFRMIEARTLNLVISDLFTEKREIWGFGRQLELNGSLSRISEFKCNLSTFTGETEPYDEEAAYQHVLKQHEYKVVQDPEGNGKPYQGIVHLSHHLTTIFGHRLWVDEETIYSHFNGFFWQKKPEQALARFCFKEEHTFETWCVFKGFLITLRGSKSRRDPERHELSLWNLENFMSTAASKIRKDPEGYELSLWNTEKFMCNTVTFQLEQAEIIHDVWLPLGHKSLASNSESLLVVASDAINRITKVLQFAL